DGQGRGLRINALNKATLERVFLQDYDTFGSEDAKVSFVNKINELNNGDFIIIITSQDASYPLHQPIKEALEKIGATLFDNKQGTYREAYALIG
ncbi:interleukin-like EMT inducer domain-containing protein, partial [Clostridium perfringens]